MITEYYHAANGDHVSLSIMPDDSATLYVCAPVNNAVKFHQKYKTRRGALIAMHRMCGKCVFQTMSAHYSVDKGAQEC